MDPELFLTVYVFYLVLISKTIIFIGLSHVFITRASDSWGPEFDTSCRLSWLTFTGFRQLQTGNIFTLQLVNGIYSALCFILVVYYFKIFCHDSLLLWSHGVQLTKQFTHVLAFDWYWTKAILAVLVIEESEHFSVLLVRSPMGISF